MYFHEIRPFVRFARLFMPGPSSCGHAVIARDCRLFLLQSGECTMLTEGCDAFVMQPGACLLVPAGIPYTILPSAGTDPLFYIVNFDFTWEHAALSQTLPLLSRRRKFFCSTPHSMTFVWIACIVKMQIMVYIYLEIHGKQGV